jgi:aryl-phospho-beta-D-glucosidase BglC (GH1 family)
MKLFFRLTLLVSLFSSSLSAQFLRAEGKEILDKDNNPIILKGYGLGGWMLQEGYMMNSVGGADTQHEFKFKLQELIGIDKTQEFYDAWLDNFVTKQDIDSIASWGFNSVRVAMHYNLFTLPIEEENQPWENTWLTKGFEMIDELLNWCEQNQIYLILDMHAAPGGQGYDAAISDYDSSKPSLWESIYNRNKLIALWGKLAERYQNETWIGGYDLLNEPNWNLQDTQLRNLYVQITNKIREYDTNHLIVIEGNWFANDHTGLTPPWDDNLVYSFHKYWNYNDPESIAWIIDIREQYNVPLWMGESGENSNAWYTEAAALFERNNIGWSWWPWKRINTIAAPFSVPSNSNYDAIVSYWKGESSAPSVTDAIAGVMQLAEDTQVINNTYYKDVVDALIRQPNSSELKPFAPNLVPGIINASDYDLGTQGVAYNDTNYANFSLSTGSYSPWNQGWNYRNDGVDIQSGVVGGNGLYLGFIDQGEWVKYTIDVDQTGFYDLNLYYASTQSGGKIKLKNNGKLLLPEITLSNTTSYTNFSARYSPSLYLEAGKNVFEFEKNGNVGYNLSRFEFSHAQAPPNDFFLIEAQTSTNFSDIELAFNQPVSTSGLDLDQFEVNVNGQVIAPLTVETENRFLHFQLPITLAASDNIMISYIGNRVVSSNDTPLSVFSSYLVQNNLSQYNLIPGKLEAEDFYYQIGFELENTSDSGGGQNLAYTNFGDFAKYKIHVSQSGTYDLHFRLASQNSIGKISLNLDNGVSTSNLATIDTPQTGGWQSWQTVTQQVTLTEGTYDLTLNITKPEFNINWIDFEFINDELSIDDHYDHQIIYYPNPVENTLHIIFNNTSPTNYTIFDINGREVKKGEFNIINNKSIIQLNSLQKGVYLLKIDSKKYSLTKTFIKK